jgi:ligand-binding SRPBCC domain-containing protein
MSHIREVTLLKGSVLSVYDYVCNPTTIADQLAGKIEVELLSDPHETLKKGHDFHFLMTRFGLSQEVHIQVEEAAIAHRLRYRQTQGLFMSWVHTIEFEAHNSDFTRIVDTIEYQLPFGLLGHLLDDLVVCRDIRDILKNRAQLLKTRLENGPTLEDSPTSPV